MSGEIKTAYVYVITDRSKLTDQDLTRLQQLENAGAIVGYQDTWSAWIDLESGCVIDGLIANGEIPEGTDPQIIKQVNKKLVHTLLNGDIIDDEYVREVALRCYEEVLQEAEKEDNSPNKEGE